MKFAAAILAIVVFITSAFPVPKEYLTASTQSNTQHPCCMKQQMHCSKTEKQTKNNSKNNCTNNSCSPFSACNYYPVTQPFFYRINAIKFIVINKFPLFDENIFSNYFADIWHPPRVV
jgi:hypothetical protein